MSKIGRNNPCPCGSGKKYKWCCLRRVSVRRAVSTTAALYHQRALAFVREMTVEDVWAMRRSVV